MRPKTYPNHPNHPRNLGFTSLPEDGRFRPFWPVVWWFALIPLSITRRRWLPRWEVREVSQLHLWFLRGPGKASPWRPAGASLRRCAPVLSPPARPPDQCGRADLRHGHAPRQTQPLLALDAVGLRPRSWCGLLRCVAVRSCCAALGAGADASLWPPHQIDRTAVMGLRRRLRAAAAIDDDVVTASAVLLPRPATACAAAGSSPGRCWRENQPPRRPRCQPARSGRLRSRA